MARTNKAPEQKSPYEKFTRDNVNGAEKTDKMIGYMSSFKAMDVTGDLLKNQMKYAQTISGVSQAKQASSMVDMAGILRKGSEGLSGLLSVYSNVSKNNAIAELLVKGDKNIGKALVTQLTSDKYAEIEAVVADHKKMKGYVDVEWLKSASEGGEDIHSDLENTIKKNMKEHPEGLSYASESNSTLLRNALTDKLSALGVDTNKGNDILSAYGAEAEKGLHEDYNNLSNSIANTEALKSFQGDRYQSAVNEYSKRHVGDYTNTRADVTDREHQQITNEDYRAEKKEVSNYNRAEAWGLSDYENRNAAKADLVSNRSNYNQEYEATMNQAVADRDAAKALGTQEGKDIAVDKNDAINKMTKQHEFQTANFDAREGAIKKGQMIGNAKLGVALAGQFGESLQKGANKLEGRNWRTK